MDGNALKLLQTWRHHTAGRDHRPAVNGGSVRSVFRSGIAASLVVTGLRLLGGATAVPAGATATPTETTVISGVTDPSAIAFDGAGHIFAVAPGNIVRTNGDGTGRTTISSGSTAHGLAIDRSTETGLLQVS
jgi:hypothetical protein